MTAHLPVPLARWLLGGGALAIAVTTSAELATSPYSSWVSAFGLNPAVHLGKAVGILCFAGGILVLGVRERSRLGRWGFGACGVLALGTVAGALPYTLVEVFLPTNVPPDRAERMLEETYTAQPWIGVVSNVVLPMIVLSIVTLAVVCLRRGLGPRWVPVLSVLVIPAAIAAVAAGNAYHFPVPHPPAWLFVGLSGYSLVLGRRHVLAKGSADRGARSPDVVMMEG